jgi:hypothetical protein
MIEKLSDLVLSDLRLLGRGGAKLLWIVTPVLLCGFLLGYERQRRSKPVGILTALLVAVGSSLFAYAGPLITEDLGVPGDATRLASMVASGIGFIGAGAILRSEFNVTGLASAATIWGLGALGILIGPATAWRRSGWLCCYGRCCDSPPRSSITCSEVGSASTRPWW